MPLVAATTSVDETRSLAEAVAGLAAPGDVIVLAGDLGAGKTAFVQGFGRGAGVEERITSPTFTLVHVYEGRFPIHHLDVYRLEQLNEALPQTLRLTATLLAPDRRPDQYARVVVATPDTLHSRLLRHHDRAWSLFWPRLRLVFLPDLHRYTGVAGAHLANLLLRLQRVAIDFLSAGLGVRRVQIQPMRPRDQRKRLVQIGPKLVSASRLTRIAPGDSEPATERLPGVFEPANVVALPAVDGDGNRRELFDRRVHVNAKRRVALACTALGKA